MNWPFRRKTPTTRTFKLAGGGTLQLVAVGDKYDWSFGNIPNFGASLVKIPWPGSMTRGTGSLVTYSSAVGLAAVGEAIRLLAMTSGMVPLIVYEGEPEERQKARDSWQWYRLHEQPNDEQSAFDFFQDVTTAVEGWGNGYVWKAVGRRPVADAEDIQLFPMDSSMVRIDREGGRKVFKVRSGAGPEQTFTSREILHVRNWTPWVGTAEAPSPIGLHRMTIGTSLDREQFEASFFQNNAQTSVAIVVPGPISDAEAKEVADRFIEQHTGANAYRPAVLSDGGDIKNLTIPQKDAQFIEQKQFSVEDVARIFHITTIGMLRPGVTGAEPEHDFLRFMSVDAAPRLRRIEMALRGDRDLFPRSSGLFCEFLLDAVLRPDIQKRFAAYKDAIQGGWIESNEIREKENLPEHPEGFGLQQTPVGGAPNPVPSGNGKVPARQG